MVVLVYVVANFWVVDTTEASSSLLAFVLGGYLYLKLKRLKMILDAHKRLVEVVNVSRGTLNSIFPRTDPMISRTTAEEFELLSLDPDYRKREYMIDYGRLVRQIPMSQKGIISSTSVAGQKTQGASGRSMQPIEEPDEENTIHREADPGIGPESIPGEIPEHDKEPPEENERRFEYMNNKLFDDDFPGEGGPRIRWFQVRDEPITVVPEDGEDCITRICLYTRIATRPVRTDLWTCLSPTNKLVIVTNVLLDQFPGPAFLFFSCAGLCSSRGCCERKN